MDSSTTILKALKDLEPRAKLFFISPKISAILICAVFLCGAYLLPRRDPYNLNKVPVLKRSRIWDAWASGQWWRLFLPRLVPYLEVAYNEYSKKGKPFKIWVAALQDWVFVLPPKYVPKMRNCGPSELSMSDTVQKYLLPKFSGKFGKYEVEVASKLVNANLSPIRLIIRARTDEILEKEFGENLDKWKRLNARKLSSRITKYVSGRIVYGPSLVANDTFLNAMEHYTSTFVSHGYLLRWFNLGPLRNYVLYLFQWSRRRNLAVVTRYIADEIAKRKQAQQTIGEDEKPIDCIQWVLDENIPAHLKTPEEIAHRLMMVSVTFIDTMITSLLNLLYDTAACKEILDEIRAEILEYPAAERWTESNLAKMKKFDSFIRESFRLTPGLAPLTGWRLVMSEFFEFEKDFILPKGTLCVLPTMHIQLDSADYPDPSKFDGLRFYKKDGDVKDGAKPDADPLNGWYAFGYGRQACPGRFYALMLLKMVLGEMLLRYDIRYAGGDRPRPGLSDIEPIVLADSTVELEFRSRVWLGAHREGVDTASSSAVRNWEHR
ncbi:cytochrome P450 [Aspergillus spectabilis]